jgi:hypothetical protein
MHAVHGFAKPITGGGRGGPVQEGMKIVDSKAQGPPTASTSESYPFHSSREWRYLNFLYPK